MSLFGSLQNILMLRKMPPLSFPVFAIALYFSFFFLFFPFFPPAIDSMTIVQLEQHFMLQIV